MASCEIVGCRNTPRQWQRDGREGYYKRCWDHRDAVDDSAEYTLHFAGAPHLVGRLLVQTDNFTRHYPDEFGRINSTSPRANAAQMKAEIGLRGPIGCGVCVTPDFEAYV